MSIQSIRPESVPPLAKPTAQTDATRPAQRSPAAGTLQLERKERLLEALRQLPEVRAEVVERGKALAADPNYPSADVLNGVAERLLGKGLK